MKFLFTMEYVGERDWKNRKLIVKKYFETEKNPFVKENQSCGYSKADFDMMLDRLRINGHEIK